MTWKFQGPQTSLSIFLVVLDLIEVPIKLIGLLKQVIILLMKMMPTLMTNLRNFLKKTSQLLKIQFPKGRPGFVI